MKNLRAICMMAGLCLSFSSFAQMPSSSIQGQTTQPPIPENDMMYRKTIWRTIDLREKQNKPFFANNRQITKVLIDGVRRGELQVYKNDSLTSTLSKEQFFANMTMITEGDEPSAEEIKMGFTRQEEDDWTGHLPANAVSSSPVSNEYLPKELYLLEIKEDAIFDKKRSRMYHEIQSLTMIVPAGLKTNVRQRDVLVGSFKYADLEKVFRLHKAEARWINPQNDAEQKNLADALELRLFSSFITKVSNPDDASLEDLYGGQMQGLLAS